MRGLGRVVMTVVPVAATAPALAQVADHLDLVHLDDAAARMW
jgi:hypothetical protein